MAWLSTFFTSKRELERQLEAARRNIAELSAALTVAETEADESLKKAHARDDKYRSDVLAAAQRNFVVYEAYNKLRAELEKARKEAADLPAYREAVVKLTKSLGLLEAENQGLRADKKRLLCEVAFYQADLAHHRAENEKLQANLAAAQQETTDIRTLLRGRTEGAAQTVAQQAGELALKQEECRGLRLLCSARENEIGKLKAELQRLRGVVCSDEDAFTEKNAKLAELEKRLTEQAADYEKRIEFQKAAIIRQQADIAAKEHEIKGLKITERAYNLMAAACDSQARREAEGHDAE